MAQASAVGLATLKGIRNEPLDVGRFVDQIVERVAPRSDEMAQTIDTVKGIKRGRDLRETIRRISSRFSCDVSAMGAVPPALASFLLTESFRDTVVVAVNCGGDTDTIGAMAGALAGAYYGYAQIPDEWLEPLENGPKGRDYVILLAERLADIKSKQTDKNLRT
jgi:poly(ADP-ribose) glycohydrolase ARH3